MTDLIVRYVEDVGYLPIVEEGGLEVYRGEYKQTPEEALAKCIEWCEK